MIKHATPYSGRGIYAHTIPLIVNGYYAYITHKLLALEQKLHELGVHQNFTEPIIDASSSLMNGRIGRFNDDGTPNIGFQSLSDALHWSRRFEYPFAYEVIMPVTGRKVLDIGGGRSIFQMFLLEEGAKVYNIDHDEQSILESQYMADLLLDATWHGYSKDVDKLEDLRNISPFDSAVCISTAEHFGSVEKTIKTIRTTMSMLKPKAPLVLTMDVKFEDKKIDAFSVDEINTIAKEFNCTMTSPDASGLLRVKLDDVLIGCACMVLQHE